MRVTNRVHAILAAGCLIASPLSACASNDATSPPTAASPASAAPSSVSTTSPTTATATTTPASANTATAKADPNRAVRKAVTAYSDAFLNAEPVAAYDLLSARCHDKVSLSYFTGIITAAKSLYGKALPIRDFKVKVRDDLAVVSYRYDLPALNQENEPWVLESGKWKNDEC